MEKLYLDSKDYDLAKLKFFLRGFKQIPGIKKDENGLCVLYSNIQQNNKFIVKGITLE